MDPRKISVKLRRDPRETAERHSQANPLTLECTLASGETVTETMNLRAELHAAQTPATTPLAATATVVMASGSTGPWELEFSGAQMNQTVLPDSAEDFWLVIYATNAGDDLFTLAKMALTLTFDNVSQVTPSPPEPALFLDLGGTQWKTAESYLIDDVVALSGSIYVCTANNTSGTTNRPGSGASWTSFWTLFSGGGGSTSLTMTRTANAVTITPSGGGTAATIPQANNTNAGVLTAAHHAALEALGTMSTQAANNVAITGGAITGTTVSGVTLSGSSTPTLAVTGTASIAGTTSGTNTGDQTITLTGDVTGSGTGSFAATIAANAVTYAKMQAVSAASRLLGRGTAGTTAVREVSLGTGLSMSGDVLSATATGGGTNTILQFFPRDAEFPSTNFATIDTRNNHPCLDFDETTTETVFFTGFIPQGATFAGTGTALTFVLESTATSATSGNIGWNVALERIVAGGIDIDADNFGTAQGGSAAVNATSGIVTEVSVTFTQAQLPTSLAAGDMIRVRVQRNTSVSGDHTGDAELLGVYANMTPQPP
jgi:hypothetical protein